MLPGPVMPEGHIMVLEALNELGTRKPGEAGDEEVVFVLVVFQHRGASSSGRAFAICAIAARVMVCEICIEIGYCG